MAGCVECLGRIPFASIIATVLVCVGAGIVAGTLYEALRITADNIFEDIFLFNVYWLNLIKYAVIVVASGMGLIAILLLIFGCLTTGATRQRIYSSANCIMGGRITAIFFMVIIYIFNMSWVLISGVLVIPVIIFVMMKGICYEKVDKPLTMYPSGTFFTYECFELAQFGYYRNTTIFTGKNMVCNEDLKKLCQYVSDAGPMYCVAYCGSVVLILGLTHYLICLSFNYTRIKIHKELSEYRNAMDIGDGDGIANSEFNLSKDDQKMVVF